jgi:hypothetical protein
VCGIISASTHVTNSALIIFLEVSFITYLLTFLLSSKPE